MTISLANDRPDFEDIFLQMLTAVQAKSGAWKDLRDSSTGNILIEIVAGLGSMLHYNLERAVQEVAGFESSLLPNSVYTLALLLGVSPRRKRSARTRVTLGIPDPLAGSVTIPKYSQFDIAGAPYYNSEDISFPPNTEVVTGVELVQGQMVATTRNSNGQANQQFTVSQEFAADESFFRVTVNGTDYTRERTSLVRYSVGQNAFLERTQPDGSVQITLGNSQYASIPSNGQSIVIRYADSRGDEVNTASTNLTVKMTSIVNTMFGTLAVTGFTESGIVGGAVEDSPDVMRYTAPRIFAAGERAITRQDWEAISLKFPIIPLADVKVWAEADDFTGDNSRMNIVRLTPLPVTGGVLSAGNVVDLLNYLAVFKSTTTGIKIIHPVAVALGVIADVFYKSGFDPNSVQNEVVKSLNTLFSIKIGSLGRAYYVSEIYRAIQTVKGVDYVELATPVRDLILAKNEYATLNSVVINMKTSSRS